MIVLQIIVTIFFVWVDAWTDAERWKDGVKIHHLFEAVLRAAAIFFISGFDLKTFILLLSIFWILFDYLLYAYMKLPWHHLGRTDFTDKLWNKLFPKNTAYWLLGLKIVALITALLIYIL